MTAGHCIAPVPGHRRPVLVHMCMLINEHTRCAAPLSYGEMLARVSEHFASIYSFKFLNMSMHVTLQLLFTSVSRWGCLVY